MATSPKEPREWGPDDSGRWGNVMAQIRDTAAEETISILRQVHDLAQLTSAGQATRTYTLLKLNEIERSALIALMLLREAGAPIDPQLIVNINGRRDQSRGRE